MLIRRKKGWELPERIATPEARYVDRRRLLAGMGIGGLILAAPAALGQLGPKSDAASRVVPRHSARPDEALASFYPAPRNARYEIDRPLTAERHAASYNNFYEFGSHKGISGAAQALRIRPWAVHIDGLVEQEMTVDIDTLLRSMPLEERVYRHRCVEAWSMTVPWSGFQMSALLDLAPTRGRAVRRNAHVLRSRSCPRAAPGMVSLAVPRRAHDRGGGERVDLPCHRVLRQAAAEAEWCTSPARGAVEVRFQIRQIDRAFALHRCAPAHVLGSGSTNRVWLLGQRQSERAPRPMEPVDRACAGNQYPCSNTALQRLYRVRATPLQRARRRAAVHMKTTAPIVLGVASSMSRFHLIPGTQTEFESTVRIVRGAEHGDHSSRISAEERRRPDYQSSRGARRDSLRLRHAARPHRRHRRADQTSARSSRQRLKLSGHQQVQTLNRPSLARRHARL